MASVAPLLSGATQAGLPQAAEPLIAWAALLVTAALVGWAVWYRVRHPDPARAPRHDSMPALPVAELRAEPALAPPDDFEGVFPTLFRRYMASMIDGLLALALVITVGMIPSEGEFAGRTKFLVFIVIGFWSEPILTSRLCTVGQWAAGIRVRRNADPDERISVGAAAVRLVVKGTLGWVSFFSLPFARRNRALHDMAAGSVVIQVRGARLPRAAA